MSQNMLDNKAAIVDKIQACDFMLDSLSRIANGDGDKAEELVKKISTKKLILMEELCKLISVIS